MNKETLSTSEKDLPKHKNALEEKYKEHQEKEPLNPDISKNKDPCCLILAAGDF